MIYFIKNYWLPCLLFLCTAVVIVINSAPGKVHINDKQQEWVAPDIYQLPYNDEGKLIRYGKELIANTADYFGPKGKIASITNGMNCQNCHIEAGTKPFGNCFSAVASLYPTFRARSGIVESIEFRINDCMQRSLNGEAIDSNSTEMKAMVAYLKWLGKNIPHGTKPAGAGTKELPYLKRAANPLAGKIIYDASCQRCHGINGEGQLGWDSSYIYPPLWGTNSFNTAAGMYRISKLAGFIKCNMPYGVTYQTPQLTDAEAWDVAAYIISKERPDKRFMQDWPDITKKAIDYPFGPYTDSFTEQQHKYGPFIPIINFVK